MSAGTLIPVEEYLANSYKPDREYRDGVLVERAMPKEKHAWLQAQLAHYLLSRAKEWNIVVYTELRIKLREERFAIPDVCVYAAPRLTEQVPKQPPLLWIEILSDDVTSQVWEKAKEVIAFGTPYVWVIDPDTLDSDLVTTSGRRSVPDQTLRLPDSPIIVPLREVLEG